MKHVLGAVVMSLALAGSASAQGSSWGVAGTFVPTWTVPGENAVAAMLFDADKVDIAGSEFRVGFVRGRMLSGDWGVSFVRRKLNDGSTVTRDAFSDPEFGNATFGEFVTLRKVTITGVEIHKFAPFGTIRRRVQIGLVFGAGVGSVKGQLDSHVVEPNYQGNQGFGTPLETRETLDAKDLIFPGSGLVALGRLELAVAALVAPGLKVRASGGVSIPGTQSFSITGLYLFGRR